MFKQHKLRLDSAFDNMSELDQQMLLALAEARAAAYQAKKPKLSLVNLLPSSTSGLLRTAS